MAKGKPTFQNFVADLQVVKKNLPSLVFCYGASDFLNQRALKTILGVVAKNKMEYTSYDADSLKDTNFAECWEQQSLFSSASASIISRVDRNKSFHKLLASIPSANSITTPLILCAEKSNASLSKEVKRLAGHTIVSSEPWPSELPKVVVMLAKELNLQFEPDAINLLIDTTGNDLSKLYNEITKLSLVANGKTVNRNLASQHLGFIREDHAFKLDQLLVDKKWNRARALCVDLVSRGEPAIHLLWVLASHCRKSLTAKDLSESGAPPAEINSALRLPPSIARNYIRYASSQSRSALESGLASCQQADMGLKTSSTSGTESLLAIIHSIAGETSGLPG